jgi:hypothetical protein
MGAYIDSWKEAEANLFAFLVSKLKVIQGTPGVASADGQNAFLDDDVHGIVPSWAFAISGGADVAQTWNHKPTELRMNADLGGLFGEREHAQAFAMALLEILPIRPASYTGGGTNPLAKIQLCRIRADGTPTVTSGPVQLHGYSGTVEIFRLDVGLEVVFNLNT